MNGLELLRDFGQLGCKDQLKTNLACRVYEQLQLAAKYTKIGRNYDTDLEIFYIYGEEGNTKHIYLPMASTHNLELYDFERIETKLKTKFDLCIFHLAVCDSASNVLFYTISSGYIDNGFYPTRKS